MAINFNVEPYYDDFNEIKKFYKILFKPGYAVQTRELNQLQSILQSQIATHGKHIFKEGSMVIPGNSSVDTNAHYVKLASGSIVTGLVGKTLTGSTSGVTGVVIHTSVDATGSDLPTLYIKYTNSGTTTTTKVFANSETLVDSTSAVVATTATSAATGIGSLASIEPGFFFIKDSFVYVPAQTIELDKYSNTPSYKIGLEATESFVTSDENETLLDNAQGSFNYSAPGADRYQIDLTLNKKNVDVASAGSFIIGQSYTILDPGTTDFISLGAVDNLPGTVFIPTSVGSGTGTAIINEQNFIQLIIVKSGKVIQKLVNSEYAILEQTLARRTYDESGDYTVRNFPIDVREYRNNYRGAWTSYTNYLAGDVVLTGGKYYRCRVDGTSTATAPSQSVGSTSAATTGVVWTYESNPYFNRGIYDVAPAESLVTQNANKDKLALGLEPGKAYVRGYEIEKTATSYIQVPKARTVLQQSNIKIPATVGNHVIVTNLNALPDVTTFPTVTLYNQLSASVGVAAGTAVGTARIRYIEYNQDTTQGTQTTKYKVSLFNIQMSTGYSFTRDVKQLFISGGSAITSFSADVFPVLNQLSGALSVSTTTVTGTGTLFNTELKTGDYIYFSIAGTTYKRRVTAIASNTSLTIDSTIGVTVAGEIGYRVETAIVEPENESLLFPATYPYVKTTRDSLGVNNTSYTVATKFTQTSTAGGVITLAATGTDTFASPSDTDNYLVLNNADGTIKVPTTIAYGSSTQQIVITMPTASAISYTIIAAINRIGSANEKTKTLNTATVNITTKTTGTSTLVKLGKTDGFRLLAVYMDTGTWASPTGVYTNDITSRYTFDDGQKSTHYDLCGIVLKSGESTPAAPIQVVFEYFTHSGAGDYYTVNSYLSTVSYDEIPVFNNIPLAYVYDFRPTIDDTGTAFSTVSLIPKRGIDIQTDFQHYLQRKDKLALNQNGSFFNVTGTSDIVASEPSDPATGMVLYKLSYKPYTYTTNSLDIENVDNKRYTMRDIGKLEKRIDNIEYYTSLSMLEQASQSLEIQDEFGFNRFKNGFVVDNFTSPGVGDIASPDYRCSIDMENGLLRPSYRMENVNLIESNTSNVQRTADGYQVTGDLVTLPYTETELAKQLDASRVENINPFAIFTFIGNVDLNPPSDEWFEVNRLPDIVTNVEGNFNSIYYIAERAGALNTIWNAWQTQWTGTSTTKRSYYTTGGNWANQRALDQGYTYVDSATANARFGAASGGGPARQIIADTTSTQVGQSRTGIRTVVTPRIDRTTTADRTLSTAVIPYIRARSLLFVVRGLKPTTTFTPFFDSVNVNTFTTQAAQITIPRDNVFSATTVVGGDASEAARLINGSSQSALNKGDVVYVKQRGVTTYTKANSPATGVLALVVNPLNGTTTNLHLVNVIGSFAAGDLVAGSITGAGTTTSLAIASTPIVHAKGDPIVSNSAGDVVGIFDIPNTSSNRFRTGVREFKLSDDTTDSSARTSVAKKQYRAEGVVETKQASVTATRNADLVQQIVNENQTIIQTSDRVVSDTGWYDPLAQTFLVDSVGGAFITSVDIFFATRDANIPVRMQIREVVNGYPGKVILPFSEVVMTPDKVNISSTIVNTTEGEAYPAPVATNFKFPSPVYLNDKTEYAIVLLSDSNNYKAWISQLGDTSVVNDRVISEQPYAGVLFKSQNASTWTANQNQDLMFKIYKAKFNTGNYGEVDFVNSAIPPRLLSTNPFYILTGTKYVRVSHENHGLVVGSSVVISGASVTGVGITSAELNGTHTVLSADIDSYVFQVSTNNATYTGGTGGSAVYATENILFNTVQPIIQEQVFQNTDITYTLKTHSGKAINGTETAYVASAFNSIAVNQNNNLSTLAMIGTTDVETANMAAEKSVMLRAELITYNENISPVIDIARTSLITVQDRTNSPSLTNVNYNGLDTRNIVSANANVAIIESNKLSTSDSATKLAFLTTNLGRYIATTGFATGSNNGTFLVTDIASDGSYIKVVSVNSDGTFNTTPLTNVSAGASVTVNSYERFVDEIAPFGSSAVAKYVTKKVKLQNTSTYLKVRFAADNEQAASIKMYYKLQQAGSTADFSKTIYTLATPSTAAIVSNNGTFSDVEYSIPNLTAFDAVQIKLVITSTYGADIVRVRDLQIIGCA